MFIVFEMVKDGELTNDVFLIAEIHNIICDKRLFDTKPSGEIMF